MNNFDDLYNFMQQNCENQKKKNFEYFVIGLRHGIDEDIDKITRVLNEKYQNDNKDDYDFRLSIIKMAGYRVFRNSNGMHKIEKIEV